MDTDVQNNIVWHTEMLPNKTKKALDFLAGEKWLKNSSWYLAGGTALALQVGNRQSVDLDFFCPEAEIDNNQVLKHFSKTEWKTNISREGTIHGELFGAKVSFIAYPFFMYAEKPAWYGAVKVIKAEDVAVMKIVAISQRGRKRDFFDLYWYVKNREPLLPIIIRLKKQYPTVAHDYHHILKSLVYFADAEKDPIPKIFFKASWKEVKNFFVKELPKITSEAIKLDK